MQDKCPETEVILKKKYKCYQQCIDTNILSTCTFKYVLKYNFYRISEGLWIREIKKYDIYHLYSLRI